MKRILFLCSQNACRSQIAEYFARALGDSSRLHVKSAGTDPAGVHPLTRTVMEERGISLADATSKTLDFDQLDQWDMIITLCGDARDRCPVTPPKIEKRHWSIPDPARVQGDEAEKLAAFREVREDIENRIHELLVEFNLLKTPRERRPGE